MIVFEKRTDGANGEALAQPGEKLPQKDSGEIWRILEKFLTKSFFLDKSPLFFLSPILFFVSLVGVNVAKKQENVSNLQEKNFTFKEVKVRK